MLDRVVTVFVDGEGGALGHCHCRIPHGHPIVLAWTAPPNTLSMEKSTREAFIASAVLFVFTHLIMSPGHAASLSRTNLQLGRTIRAVEEASVGLIPYPARRRACPLRSLTCLLPL